MHRTHFRLQRRVPTLDRVIHAAIVLYVFVMALLFPRLPSSVAETSRAVLWVEDSEVVMVVTESGAETPRVAPPPAAALPQQLH